MLVNDKKGFLMGFLTGFCAGLVSRELIPGLAKSIKPASKNILRAGITTMEGLREMLARAKEEVEDIAAEVFSELEEKPRGQKSGSKKNGKIKADSSEEG